MKEIILTFDDGPSLNSTNKLLDKLENRDLKAMFFVVGSRLNSDRSKKLVERAHQQGHIVGNHSFSHHSLTKLPQAEVFKELSLTHDLIVDITGNCSFFRPPYGNNNTIVESVAQQFKYTTVRWNVDTKDWTKEYKHGKWVDLGFDQIKKLDRSTVLMHDIHHTTVDNVEKLIDRIENELAPCKFVLYSPST